MAEFKIETCCPVCAAERARLLAVLCRLLEAGRNVLASHDIDVSLLQNGANGRVGRRHIETLRQVANAAEVEVRRL